MPEIVKISELSAAVTLDGTELVPVVQDGVTVRTTIDDIAALAPVPTITDLITDRSPFWAIANISGGALTTQPAALQTTGSGTQAFPAKDFTAYLTSLDCERRTSANSMNSNAYSLPSDGGATVQQSVSGNVRAGGYQFGAIMGSPTAQLGDRMFCGMYRYNTTIPVAGSDPSSRANICGFAVDEADVNVQFIHNDASGNATKTDLGVSWAALAGKALSMLITTPRGGGAVSYSLTVLDTGVEYSGTTAATNLPAADIDLSPIAALNTGEGAVAVQLYLNKLVWFKNT